MKQCSKSNHNSEFDNKVDEAVDFERVLSDEMDILSELRRGIHPDTETSSYQRARKSNLAGLAFSGGGIRSATFNLGVIQALSRYGLLSKFDYLSTVSGGGYIGGWLSALLHRKIGENGKKPVDQVSLQDFQQCLRTHPEQKKCGIPPCNVGFKPVENLAVRYLRRYSNYLSPRLGLSGDMLAAITIFLRNFTLIQLTLVSLVASMLVLALLLGISSKLFNQEAFWLATALQSLGRGSVLDKSLSYIGEILSTEWPFVAGALLLFFAFWSAGRLLPERVIHEESYQDNSESHKRNKQANLKVYLAVILPTLVAAWWFSVSAATRYQQMPFSEKSSLLEILHWIVAGIIGYGAAWSLGFLGKHFKNSSYTRNAQVDSTLINQGKKEPVEEMKYTKLKICLSAVISGALFGLLLYAAACHIRKVSSAAPIDLWHAIAFGTPIFILCLSFIVTIHIGLARRTFTEAEREWLARLGGFVLLVTASWFLIFTLLLYATPLVHWLAEGGLAALAVWISSSSAGAWLARGPSTGNIQGGVKWKEFITRLAPWVFLVGLAVLVTHLTHVTMLEALTINGYVEPPGSDFTIATTSVLQQLHELPLVGTFIGFLLLVTLFVVISWRLDINLFSLHALYCNRLARAYLGASRAGNRIPNPFSGFDVADDLPFSELTNQRPIHIINTAINMTGGDDLAWQTRRAASFAFTPQWSGYETLDSQGEKLGSYRPTRYYAGNRKLGTLIAVSGAAASPNMGYHTSAAVAAMMTAFNLRLGRWCGNPDRDTWDQISPRFAVKPIFAELSGSATAQADWINLTDGGHFDNLGVYELIRRRCRLILVVDAGCDPKQVFDDLANTVRKCWTDLGVNIRFEKFDPVHLKKNSRYSESHSVVGRIQYYDNEPEGAIIYLKSSMTGDEWPDIRQYADAHKDFPHETTADQFFNENQFEAYRHLGYKVIAKMAETLKGLDPDVGTLTIEKIANGLVPPKTIEVVK